MRKSDWLAILFLGIIFSTWLSPRLRVATDFPYTPPSSLQAGWQLPQTWTDRWGNGLGDYAVSTLWAWPVDILYAAGSHLGLTLPWLQLTIGLLPGLLAGFYALRKLGGSWAALIYLSSTYFILLVDGGQLALAAAYGFLPLTFYCYLVFLNQSSLPRLAGAIFSLLALSIFDIRIIYLLLILIATHSLVTFFWEHRIPWRKNLIYCTAAFFTLGGFHAYWLLPALLVRLPSLPPSYTHVSQLSFLSFASLGHALLNLQPHWPANIFGQIAWLKFQFVWFPTVAFSALWLIRHSRAVFFWSVIAIVGLFLVKGTNPPFAGGYSWAFTHIPGFSLFRDPVKFFPLITLAYSLLISLVLRSLSKFRLSWIFAGLTLVLLVGCLYPIFTSQLTGTFSSPRFLTDYLQANTSLAASASGYRVLWVPSRPPLGFSDPTHQVLEGTRLAELRPFSLGSIGTYETMNFLRDGSNTAKLLSLLGVGWVVYPPLDPLRDDIKIQNQSYYHYFLHQLQLTPWSVKSAYFGQVPVLSVRDPLPQFFIPSSTVFTVGSLAQLDHINPADTAVVFSSATSGLLTQLSRFPSATLSVGNHSTFDAAAALLPSQNLFNPSAQLGSQPTSQNWWSRTSSDFLWVRNYLRDNYHLDLTDWDYGTGYAINETAGSHEFSSPQFTPDRLLLARVLSSTLSGQLRFYQGDRLIGQLDTQRSLDSVNLITLHGLDSIPDKQFAYSPAELVWQPIGQLVNQGPIRVVSSGLNIVNVLGVVSPSQWQAYQDQVGSYPTSTPTASSGQVVATKLSPTRYRLDVTQLSQPASLVFSATYDPLWQLNGQVPVPAYGLVNLFPLTGNGIYYLEYTPQQYVLPGLGVTVFILLIWLGLGVWYKLKP